MTLVEIEGIGSVEFPDDMTPEQITHAIERDILRKPAPAAPQSPSFGAQLASAAVRPIAKAAAGLPLMAADAGYGLVNFLREKRLPTLNDFNPFAQRKDPLPSDYFNAELDANTLPPSGIGKGAEFVSTMLAGSRVPTGVKPEAPQPPRELTQAEKVFQAGRREGLVAPPSTVKPTAGKVLVESVGGKAATQQVASRQNQAKFNELARRELGMPKGAPITRETLKQVREPANRVYEAVAKSGDITPDPQYADEIARIGQLSDEIAGDFPEANVAAGKEVADLVKSLERPGFKASSAMAYLRELRKQATANLNAARLAGGDPAKQALGLAQRDAAGALEDLVVRHLTAQGKADLAKQFDEARTLIAKSHSVETALNPSTGNVAARQLGTQLKRGKPLSGGLKTAADFANAFPKASDEITHSGPVSALDAFVMGGGGLGLHPAFFAWPGLRMAARYGSLSSAMQDGLLPAAQGPVRPDWLLGAGAGAESLLGY